MFASLFGSRLALESVKPLARPIIYLAAGVTIFGAAWLGVRWDEARFEAVRADAAREKAAAIEARDNHWKGEIARANAETEARRADAAVEAGKVSASLIEQNSALAARVAEMEKANAALPNPDACGLDRDRVRLLREQSR